MRKRSRRLLAITILRILFVSYGYNRNYLATGGSTAMMPVMSYRAMNFSYHGYRFTYEGVGSGTGISRLIDGVYALAASDEYVPAEIAEKYDLLNLPVLVQAFVFVVNLPFDIRLNASIIADIYLGKVAYRDDPEIKSLNPDVDLPHKPIYAVHRKDSSGTTAVITSRLAKNSEERKKTVGSSDSVYRPVDETGRGIPAIGNSGVAETVKETPYSIGYVGYAWAMELKLRIAKLPNGSNEFVEPSIEEFQEAVESFDEAYGIPGNFSVYILDAPRGRPIVSFGYAVIYKGLRNLSPDAREAVKAFFRYILTTGQGVLPSAYFAPLPAKIISRVLDILSSS